MEQSTLSFAPVSLRIILDMGRVFASGFGGSFALGTESNQTTSKFEPVPALMQHYHAVAKNIACGMYHSGCVTEDGRVFLWGM